MGQAEFKEKLGNRGPVTKGEKTFNTKSGTKKTTFHNTWQGKTKGAIGAKKKKLGEGYHVEF